ncbi:MAG: IS3 family transposase [Methanococcaceae archaeon]
MAFDKTKNLEKIILHSDQGAQYTSRFYAKTLVENGIIQSMSNRGNCLDNAPCECFFSHLKSELIYLQNFMSIEHMINEVEAYIKFYNTSRIQLRLKKMAPVEYRNHFVK